LNDARVLAISAVLFVARPAGANGRYPEANQLVGDASDPAHLVLRATYGIVQSTSSGLAWSYVCEESVGFSGEWDPPLAVTGDGTLLAGLPTGLARTVDRGCAFTRASVPIADRAIRDLALDPSAPARAVAVESPLTPRSGFRALVAETVDHGASWTSLGLLSSDFEPTTIEVAKNGRIYVMGAPPSRFLAMLLRSDDRGAT
jgi:hypothetical protein